MRSIVSYILLFVSINMHAQEEHLRSLFFKTTDQQGIEFFYNSVRYLECSNAVLFAYKGVATAMYAECVNSVADKFHYFSEGKSMIESALEKDRYNAEIRFLRMSVQSEVPFFLGYSRNIEEDAEVVIGAIENGWVDPNSIFWSRAIGFMKNNDDITSAQKSRLIGL